MTLDTSSGSNTPSARSGPRRPLFRGEASPGGPPLGRRSRRVSCPRSCRTVVPADGACSACGRCWWCWRFRRACRCGCCGPIPRPRVRPCTFAPGIWNGRTGCMARRSRRSRSISPARRSSTRRSARSRTASAGWRAPGSCRWRSCSARPSCCGVPPAGCSAGGPRSSPARCSPCWAPPFTWGRSPLTTRCRCSWSRWRPGA